MKPRVCSLIGRLILAVAATLLVLADPAGAQTWTVTAGSMVPPGRSFHTETLLSVAPCGLNCGKVLVTGDYPGAELYDPVSDTWASTLGPPLVVRASSTATLLAGPNCGPSCGKVLIVGGCNGFGCPTTTELYDPVSDTFSFTGSLTTIGRQFHTATLLRGVPANCGTNCGKVLVAAGNINIPPWRTDTAELYDPITGSWTPTGSLGLRRGFHTATYLTGQGCFPRCGLVLVAGGVGSIGILATAELYDPVSALWTPAASMATARYSHTATLLRGADVPFTRRGEALVAGGYSGIALLTSAERYDPTSNTWVSAGNMIVGRLWHTATLVVLSTGGPPRGRVLVAGGEDANCNALGKSELYRPPLLFGTGTWTVTATMNTARSRHTATLLTGPGVPPARQGEVLVAAGGSPNACANKTNRSERFRP